MSCRDPEHGGGYHMTKSPGCGSGSVAYPARNWVCIRTAKETDFGYNYKGWFKVPGLQG